MIWEGAEYCLLGAVVHAASHCARPPPVTACDRSRDSTEVDCASPGVHWDPRTHNPSACRGVGPEAPMGQAGQDHRDPQGLERAPRRPRQGAHSLAPTTHCRSQARACMGLLHSDGSQVAGHQALLSCSSCVSFFFRLELCY